MTENPILWTPSGQRADASTMAQFERWLEKNRDLKFKDYNAMWDWSVSDLDGFWSAIWEYFDIIASVPYSQILKDRTVEHATWLPDARLNYAQNILRHAAINPLGEAIVAQSETFARKSLTWRELETQVGSVAASLRKMGVVKGDRVVAILPNTEAALIAFLASASIGAIWSICAPDMGHVAILDRFRQIEPKVLIAQDGYTHAGVSYDKQDVIDEISTNLNTVTHRVMIPVAGALKNGWTAWDELTEETVSIDFEQVASDHPLWIVYSSGTTGNPKPIVHGHGGVLLEAAKQSLHHDLGPDDRFSWVTSSGWIMWNAQWMALGQGTTVVMFDGAPGYPNMNAIWEFVARENITFFGAGAALFAGCLKAGIKPIEDVDLTALRSLGSTGSPLSPDAYNWIYNQVKSDVWLAPISGGTDLAGAFVLGHPAMPVRTGEMQCRALGNAVRAYDDDGTEVFGQVGELVCTQPLPSMPLFFWGDGDGSRLHESYFDTYPNVWRHGDWIEIKPNGASIIYGRSDATINRKGLRLGSAEIYQAVEGLDQIQDSLVVDLEFYGRDSFMPLFVVMGTGAEFSDATKEEINQAIRSNVSARFIPSEIVQITDVPRTMSGKKLEVPVKKLLLGGDPAKIVNRDSMANPDSFDFFVQYAKGRAK